MSVKVFDVECRQCHAIWRDQLFESYDTPTGPCCACGGERVKLLSFRSRPAAWHPSERVVVYQGPGGDIKYPGRNDRPMPERYRAQGYQRVEMSDLPSVTRFEKSQGVMCHAMHYDRNGISDRETFAEHKAPEPTYSNLLEP